VPSASELENYLSDTVWGRQANVYFTVTRTDTTMNYDLDRNCKLAFPTNSMAECDAISAAAKNSSTDFNIYYVAAVDQAIGWTINAYGETWTAANGANSPVNHTAHEVGHLLGIINYESTNSLDVMLSYGDPSNPYRVIRHDWNIVNP